jgi:hypothetical protein
MERPARGAIEADLYFRVAAKAVEARPSRSAPAASDMVIAFSVDVLQVCVSWGLAHATLAGSTITLPTSWPLVGFTLRQKRR